MKDTLLPRQKEFCQQIVKNDGKVKVAWEAAGYRGCTDGAYRLMKSPLIKAEISRIKGDIETRKNIDGRWFQRVALELLEEARNAKDFSASAKLLEIAAKKHGIGDPPQRFEFTGPGGGPIESRSMTQNLNVELILSPRRVSDGKDKEGEKGKEGPEGKEDTGG